MCDSDKNVQPVLDRLTKLENVMADLRVSLFNATSEGNGIKETVKSFNDTNEEIYNSLYFLERNVSKLEQYSKKENIDIFGIKQIELENTVGEILRGMGDKAQSLLTTFKGINKGIRK